MNKLLKTALILLALFILAGFLVVWFLPTAVEALPGQVRGRLPEQFLRAVTTPLPTALPPPAVTPAANEAIIASLILPTATAVTGSTAEASGEGRASDELSSELAAVKPEATETRNYESSAADDAPVEAEPIATRNPPLATPSLRNGEVSAVDAKPIATRGSPLAKQSRIDGLEIVPQKLNNCGPATLSINLNYYGLEQTQFDVAGVVKPRYDDRNVSPEELVNYTNQYTELEAALFRGGDLDLLKTLIAAGFPVIIEKGYEPDEWQGWMGHYLTLYGYDEQEQMFDTMDTFLGPWDSSGRSVSYQEIETGWQQFNQTFYLVYPPGKEAAVAEIIGPIFDDEPLMWQEALDRARAQISDTPEDAFAWFNLGSSLTRLGQINDDQGFLNAAATAFDQARLIGLPPRMLWYQFEPYEAYLAAGRADEVIALTTAVLDNAGGRDVEETYLYRGQARLAQGDPEGARADFRRALELRPGFPAAQAALNRS